MMQWRPSIPTAFSKPPFFRWIAILAILGLLVECTTNYLENRKTTQEPVAVIAQVNPSVKSVDKMEVVLETPKKTIRVYPAGAKAKVNIPSEAVENANIKLTDSSVIRASERPTEVTQVLDITTGETKTYVTSLPSPWFRFEHKGSASLDYGYKRNNNSPVLRLNVRENVVQIKDVHLGVTGSLFTDGDYFVGVGGEYRW